MATWDPFVEMEALRREVDRVFEGFGMRRWPRAGRVAFLPGLGARQYPLVNLYEDDGHVYVEALAPGVDPKSLELSVAGDTLTIKGEKPGLAQVAAEAYHRNERAAGRFIRSIELPAEVDREGVTADYRNGLLLITMPKSAAAKPRQIPISLA